MLGGREFPIEFYNQLFDWGMTDACRIVTAGPTTTTAEATIAFCTVDMVGRDDVPAWLPSIRVTCLKAAVAEVEAGGGAVLSSVPQRFGGRAANLINDPHGTRVYLVAE